jgi:hypothetical protein
VVVAQMIETECEELEWQIAVERARSVAEVVPALVARTAPPPLPRSRPEPPRSTTRALPPRYRWSSTPARAAKR